MCKACLPKRNYRIVPIIGAGKMPAVFAESPQTSTFIPAKYLTANIEEKILLAS